MIKIRKISNYEYAKLKLAGLKGSEDIYELTFGNKQKMLKKSNLWKLPWFILKMIK
jgi:hypothetical protein